MATTKSLLLPDSWKKNFEEKSCLGLSETFADFDELLATTAAKELREDKYTREQCLEQFRDWIKQNPDIENCLMDDGFLLKFLRSKKFSLPMAQQTLLKYLNFRKRFKDILFNLDCLDPALNEIFSKGYIFASPFRDGKGRRVLLHIGRNFDPIKFTSKDMARAHAIAYETVMDDEENQIMGVTHFGDILDCGTAYVTMWQISEFIPLLRWGEQSFPMRHKEIHVINTPPALKYFIDMAKSLFSQKLKERVNMYEKPSDLNKHLDPRVLPKEYGGTMPMADMIELWKKEMIAKRSRLLSLDQMNLLSDRGIIRRNSKILSSEELPGSFRKLELD